jgi:hypothetical protein
LGIEALARKLTGLGQVLVRGLARAEEATAGGAHYGTGKANEVCEARSTKHEFRNRFKGRKFQ